MMPLFTLNQHVNALADYLPNGRLFEAKNIADSNFRQLLMGISGELFNAQGFIKTLNDEYIPDLTNLFLDEWERALGIPDGCFSGSGTNEERRRDILVKLAALGIQTADDFVNLAAIFGIAVEVRSGSDAAVFPMTFPMIIFDSPKDARFTIIITFTLDAANTFTYTFPLLFGGREIAVLECLFDKLKPANCNIIYQQR